jgi:hypothetical protein
MQGDGAIVDGQVLFEGVDLRKLEAVSVTSEAAWRQAGQC